MVDIEKKRRALGTGTNLAPIKDLLKAQEIHDKRRGKAAQEESLELVSRAIGSDKPLPLLRENLDKVFDRESTLSDITVTLALVETRKK